MNAWKMNRKEIKKWLMDKDFSQADIARDLGVTNSFVSNVIAGRLEGRRIVEWLREHGCPEEFLGEYRRAA